MLRHWGRCGGINDNLDTRQAHGSTGPCRGTADGDNRCPKHLTCQAGQNNAGGKCSTSYAQALRYQKGMNHPH